MLLQTILSSLKANIEKYESELGGSPIHLWKPELHEGIDDPENLMPSGAFNALDKIRTDLRAIDAAVTPTRFKLIELALAAIKPSALNVAVTLSISDAIEEFGGSATIEQLASRLDVNDNKLARIIRILEADYIYKETEPNRFENTRHSMSLLKKTGSDHFLSLTAELNTIASTSLLKNMIDAETKNSFAPEQAPFCYTTAKNGETFFEHIMQPENTDLAAKVELGVVPWLNRITRGGLVHDYPWKELSGSSVVDIGCGPGDSGIDVLRLNPTLQWTFQDLLPVIENLKKNFPADLSKKIQSGTVNFVVQDYLQPNVSRGDIWYLRAVIRDHDDEEVVKILKHIAEAMRQTPGAKMVLNEALVSSPVLLEGNKLGATVVPSNNIPKQQSALAELANLMTWNTFLLFGQWERSFLEVKSLLDKAGFVVSRFFKLRTFTVMIECKLAE